MNGGGGREGEVRDKHRVRGQVCITCQGPRCYRAVILPVVDICNVQEGQGRQMSRSGKEEGQVGSGRKADWVRKIQ